MPGLWDVHKHLGDLIPDPKNLLESESIPDYTIRAGRNAIAGLQKGITSVRVVGEDYDACLAWRKAFKKKVFIGPNIYTSVRGISATGGHGHGTDWKWWLEILSNEDFLIGGKVLDFDGINRVARSELLKRFNEYTREHKPNHWNWSPIIFFPLYKKLIPFEQPRRIASGWRECEFP